MAEQSAAAAAPADRQLVDRMAAGDEPALTALYDRYGAVLYALAYRILREPADAEEVIMETFAQAWREAGRYEPGRGSVPAWLTMMTRSRALDQVRSRDRRDRVVTAAARQEPDGPPAAGRWDADPARGPEQLERQQQVREALAALVPAQREAIELAYYEGLSQSEIAERLREPLGTIKTRIRLGMIKLRDLLRPYYCEPAS